MLTFAFTAAVALASPAPRGAVASPSPAPYAANDLYSRAERRRIAAYLRLRMLELHRRELDEIARTLRRRLAPELDAPGARAL